MHTSTTPSTEEALFREHLTDSEAFAIGCFRIPGFSKDEIAQVARLALWESACRWRGPSATFDQFRDYSRAVIRNKLRTEFTRAVRRVRREHIAEPSSAVFTCIPSEDASVYERADRAACRDQVATAIAMLEARHARTVRAWIETPSLRSVADALGLHSQQAAHYHLRRAFGLLRASLAA